MPRERKRQEGIKFVPMWTAATGDGSNLESPRAPYSAVVMFLNNGGRKETLSKMDDRRELFTTVNRPKMITHG